MDNLETVQILLKIADTLDKKSLFKEASSITNIMNRVVVSGDAAGDSTNDAKDTEAPKTETTETKPTEGQEKQYQLAIQRLKNQLFSGERTPKEIHDFVNASNTDTNGFYHNFVSNGALTEKQFEAFKIQIKSMLLRYTDISATEKPNVSRSTRLIDNTVQRLLNMYMTQKNLTIRDLLNEENINKAKTEIQKVIENNPIFKEKKSELLTQLERTLKSYKQASNNKLIKEAQQINRYNAEDINVQELRNGNLEETHNLGSIMPGENLTSNQAQSLVSRIYKRDKDFIESTFTFQLRHNDDNTLDIIVNIQDK